MNLIYACFENTFLFKNKNTQKILKSYILTIELAEFIRNIRYLIGKYSGRAVIVPIQLKKVAAILKIINKMKYSDTRS